MAQGSDGAFGFRWKLKNGRRTGGESGGCKLRRDHKNGALTLRAVENVVKRFVRANTISDRALARSTTKPRPRDEGASALTNVFYVADDAVIDGIAL
jgi:hypothetical protein